MIACASRLLPDPVPPSTMSGTPGSGCSDRGDGSGVAPLRTVMPDASRQLTTCGFPRWGRPGRRAKVAITGDCGASRQ